MPESTRADRSSSEEYFAPLVDQSSDSNSIQSNDHPNHSFVPISPTSPRRMATPANPQSPGEEQESHQQQHQQQHSRTQQQQHLQQQQHNRNSNESTPFSTDPNNILPRSLVFAAHKRKSTFSVAVTAFCILGFCLYSNARSSLHTTVKEVDELVVFSQKVHQQLRRADYEIRLLERELTALDALEARREDEEIEERVLSQSSAFANPELIQEMEIIQKKLKQSQIQADKLKTQVSEISKEDAIAKYGSGVIRVKMDLIFPGTTVDGDVLPDTGPSTIIIEMASLDIMPHSVYTFLEMISAKLLDGCSFILNALHVLKAAPLPYDNSSASIKARQFQDHGLESVAFREYSHDFPHDKYTVGFAADGSPSFYINTEDNSEIHVGEPCFARIVSGFNTVQRLEDLPTRNGIWFEQRIGIKEVTIL
eukprot:CAMPEP_0168193192 /NCGR_PEP_ID=MMETSP0139_2-20121125/18464_1 /TAXON_ID=44445 /ORGANISM="Pseudo-nitzschia australis, Strain 10249 10 AB" /LENGTH=422 /DNA_ID=CAMNT_0008116509 /DNA_START=169 /DNA_END=1437 /DNA_ORIENTATION=+